MQYITFVECAGATVLINKQKLVKTNESVQFTYNKLSAITHSLCVYEKKSNGHFNRFVNFDNILGRSFYIHKLRV